MWPETGAGEPAPVFAIVVTGLIGAEPDVAVNGADADVVGAVVLTEVSGFVAAIAVAGAVVAAGMTSF